MKHRETYEVIHKGNDLSIRISTKTFKYFAELTGKQAANFKDPLDTIRYFFCSYRCACEHRGIECRFTLEAFVNYLEEYPEIIYAYNDYIEEDNRKHLQMADV